MTAKPQDDRLRTFNRILGSLARHRAITEGDLPATCRVVLQASVDALGVRRGGIWLYSPDRTAIRCVALYDSGDGTWQSGTELLAEHYPAYFEAIGSERTMAAADAPNDPRTREFASDYFAPKDIRSTLDAPVRVGGQVVGVICHEVTGAMHEWTADEEAFAGSVGDLLGLAMQWVEQRDAERRLREREAELLRAEKMEAVARIAGGIAHDFNNLLTVIRGNSDLALRTLGDSDAARPFVEEIRSTVGPANALTQDLLAVCRRQALEPREVDLGEIVGGAATMMQRVAGTGVRVMVQPAQHRTPAFVDVRQLERALLNLVTNARDASSDGAEIIVRVESLDLDRPVHHAHGTVEAGHWVTVDVEDTGQGIAEDVLPFVFDPFFTTKHEGQGTGLGLATVLGIAEQSGGRVAVRTTSGQGTGVTLYLPRKEGLGNRD